MIREMVQILAMAKTSMVMIRNMIKMVEPPREIKSIAVCKNGNNLVIKFPISNVQL